MKCLCKSRNVTHSVDTLIKSVVDWGKEEEDDETKDWSMNRTPSIKKKDFEGKTR